MRAALDLIGWEGLSPYEQMCVVAGIGWMGWLLTATRALLDRPSRRKRKKRRR